MSLLVSQISYRGFTHLLCEIINWHHLNNYILLYFIFCLKNAMAWLRGDVEAAEMEGEGKGVSHMIQNFDIN